LDILYYNNIPYSGYPFNIQSIKKPERESPRPVIKSLSNYDFPCYFMGFNTIVLIEFDLVSAVESTFVVSVESTCVVSTLSTDVESATLEFAVL